MKKVNVLRDYDAVGHGSGKTGETKEISDAAFAYLIRYDTELPLIAEADPKDHVKAATPAPEPEPLPPGAPPWQKPEAAR